MKFRIRGLKCHSDKAVVGIVLDDPHDMNELKKLEENDLNGYVIDIKPPKRSRTINNYMWHLLHEIAEKINMHDMEVYRWAVREAGVTKTWYVEPDKVNEFIELWSSQGIGWFCTKNNYTIDGKVEILCYKGTSVYDRHQMNRLVDWVVDEAKFCGIKVKQDYEIESLLREWGE